MTKAELNGVLEKHEKWLGGDNEGKMANLRGANLRGADLSGANLKRADLSEANLREANLRGADLSGASLRGANLEWADLSEGDLRGANLKGADLIEASLSEADLRGANLKWAELSGANLSGANLSGANLKGAELSEGDLRGANLKGADLSEASLREADLRGVKNVFFPLGCPEVGEFVAFKKAANSMIVKLKIPANAKRSSATTRKCRCDKAIVLSIENADGTQGEEKSVSSVYDKDFVYTVGQEVSVPNFDDNRWNECSTGIHFFITRQEAVEYEI